MHSQQIRQRRRRVTLDQTQNEERAAAARKSRTTGVKSRNGKKRRTYTEGARRSRQFKTTDLIPKRIWSVAAVVALLLAAIAGLNLLHLHSPEWLTVIGEEGVAALSLDSGHGLAVWYSNFLLLLTSCVSLQLYLLRQHRRDDYRASYRVWMWLALIFLLASAASVTGISSLLKNLFTNAVGSGSIAGGLTLVLAVKILGLLLLVVRGLVEVRFSRLAVFALLVVFAAYGGAALMTEVPDVQSEASNFIHAARGNCLLLGATALLVSIIGFARYVYLEANGLIQPRVRKQSGSQTDSEPKSVKKAKPARKKKTTRSADDNNDSTSTGQRPRRQKAKRDDNAEVTTRRKSRPAAASSSSESAAPRKKRGKSQQSDEAPARAPTARKTTRSTNTSRAGSGHSANDERLLSLSLLRRHARIREARNHRAARQQEPHQQHRCGARPSHASRRRARPPARARNATPPCLRHATPSRPSSCDRRHSSRTGPPESPGNRATSAKMVSPVVGKEVSASKWRRQQCNPEPPPSPANSIGWPTPAG